MADLGFLPAVRRLLGATPAAAASGCSSRRRSTTAIDVLVKRFLTKPVTHQADSAQSPVSTMAHHVLHVQREQRLAGPGRPDQRARPHRGLHPHQARRQGARPAAQPAAASRASSCTATSPRTPAPATSTRSTPARRATLVATDIAARGIHVDDVALVIHADPPVEHKAYLHRSGRTARAGAAGTVDHADDRRPGPRRPHPDAAGRHLADHDQGPRPGPPDPGPARPGRAGRWSRSATSPSVRPPAAPPVSPGRARSGGGGRSRSRRGGGSGQGRSGQQSGQKSASPPARRPRSRSGPVVAPRAGPAPVAARAATARRPSAPAAADRPPPRGGYSAGARARRARRTQVTPPEGG